MFKLASFTDEISHDLAHACQICNDFGVEGVELRGIWNKVITEFTDSGVREVKKIVGDHGLKVCCISGGFFKRPLEDEEALAKDLESLPRSAEIAHELDCPYVRGFGFWDPDNTGRPWDEMRKTYEPVPQMLEELDIVMAVENEHECRLATAAHMRRFLDDMGSDRLKIIWDPGNHVFHPEGRDVPVCPDAYSLIQEDVVHIHVKDARCDDSGEMRWCYMGTGIVGWEQQFQTLKDTGYEGYVSLETHVDSEDMPDEMKPKYGHHLTGEGREGASKVSLAWIRDALA